MEPHHRRPGRREGGAPLGGKLSRSLRSLRPIAAASVVAGPWWFAEGAWIHCRGGAATSRTGHPQGVGPHPRPGIPRGLDHAQGGASRGGGVAHRGATRAASEPACRRAHAGLTRWNRTTDGRASGKVHRRSAASCLARCAHCDPLPLRCLKSSGQVPQLPLGHRREGTSLARKKPYSQEFKDEAVRMVLDGPRPIVHVARELGGHETTLVNWVTEYKREHGQLSPQQASDPSEREAELEREVRKLREENRFLKKAASFFAAGNQ